MATTTTCKRHPSVETRLSCSNCGDPICARCAVPSAVGQKCPGCAKQPRGARALGKPRQYVKGAAAGLGAALVGGVLLYVVVGIGFLTLIASLAIGYGVGRAVQRGAEGNAAWPFAAIAVVLAVVLVEVVWLAYGYVFPPGLFGARLLGILYYAAAGYGAYLPFR